MLVSQHRKTVILKNCQILRCSSTGNRTLVSRGLSIVRWQLKWLLVDGSWIQRSEFDAYAEIIATRPLGMWCTVVHQWMSTCHWNKDILSCAEPTCNGMELHKTGRWDVTIKSTLELHMLSISRLLHAVRLQTPNVTKQIPFRSNAYQQQVLNRPHPSPPTWSLPYNT